MLFLKTQNEIFEFPKMTFVYIIGSAIAFILFKQLIEGKLKVKQMLSPISILVLLFLFSNALSTVFSMSHYTSVWGYYSRFNGGLASITIFSLLYFAFSYALNSQQKKEVLDFALLSTIPVCLYAIAQHFGFEKGFWEEDSSARVFSTFGQPNWLSAYLVLIYFYAFEKALHSNFKKPLFFLLCLNYAAFWFTYSLSGILGFAFGLVFFLILSLRGVKDDVPISLDCFALSGLAMTRAREGCRKLIFGLLVFIFIFSLLNLGILKPKIKDSLLDIKNTISQYTIAYASEENPKRNFGDTTGIRIHLWKGTFNLIKSSPKNFWVGTGPETFPYSFINFRPLELNYSSEWNFVFNKPHNYYLELWANLGLIGLVVYLALYRTVLKNAVSAGYVGIFSGLVAYFVSNFFGWPTVSTNLIFFLFVAVINNHEKI